jgi:hypothetical protein
MDFRAGGFAFRVWLNGIYLRNTSPGGFKFGGFGHGWAALELFV